MQNESYLEDYLLDIECEHHWMTVGYYEEYSVCRKCFWVVRK
jgi:hypothetical protein